MSLVEILIISVGLSLDVFAVVVCQGAVLLKIERGKLLKMCLIFCAWQVCAVLAGHVLTLIPVIADYVLRVKWVGQTFAVIIFSVLGVYMLYKAVKRETVMEHLSEIHYKQICVAACFTSWDAFLAGLGFGFLNVEALEIAVSILVVTAIVVVLGLFTGYRLGYEQKTKAYGIGGVLLLISAVDIIVRFLA